MRSIIIALIILCGVCLFIGYYGGNKDGRATAEAEWSSRYEALAEAHDQLTRQYAALDDAWNMAMLLAQEEDAKTIERKNNVEKLVQRPEIKPWADTAVPADVARSLRL